MYSFFKSAGDEVIDNIDSDNLHLVLKDLYQCEGQKLEIKIKKTIKKKEELTQLSIQLSMDVEELLYLLVKAYPNIFNHRLIKFIRKEYLFPEEDNE